MIYILWLLCFINLYFGLRFFLNVIHVLRTSKYSKGATTVFAVLFLSMGVAGAYYNYTDNTNIALLINIGPWAIAFIMLLINMITGNYQ